MAQKEGGVAQIPCLGDEFRERKLMFTRKRYEVVGFAMKIIYVHIPCFPLIALPLPTKSLLITFQAFPLIHQQIKSIILSIISLPMWVQLYH